MIKARENELAVGIQVKTRSWNFDPTSVTRLYATTTISHMVEIMALMGMYWREFDCTQLDCATGTYRAGNNLDE